ncbi:MULTISPECIES: MBL fold metallo-hydrolase [Streptomyces]|uniref:Metallo-beta-lactamase domain-containing protein 1 n=1 Tax=Streptomyces griseiscabiei TaxID=2993540 RepID=A0ABU4L6P3_9ACTN|nr:MULTISPECIES: MBL fold metallo-hydrolase [Streptomyces]MBZ3906287.1 MBL fold metallo-hydrolase [Streptomyces griseiscabiei]MDX2911283.1 MBL fold metallo-hydrolase [Streptomyces griseiscabiei]
MTATFHVLTTGYADTRVAGTVTLLLDGATVAVVDPGMVADRRLILDPLVDHGLTPEDITDVVFSHHHPDHTLNAALFPEARFHDHMAVYRDDIWEDRDADGHRLSPSITLMTTPGHTAEDVSTLVTTAEGLVVLTHLWWTAEGPADDPFAPDREQLRAAREKVLALDPVLIVPGHGAPFAPSASTPL